MSVELCLDFIRHGIAATEISEAGDAARPLTDKGQKRTTQIAQRLKTLGWHWQIVLTSPLLRAQQTAAILLEEGLTDQVQEFSALSPGGSFAELVAWHEQHSDLFSVAVVGHQPGLGQWITAALWGQPQSVDGHWDVIELKKAGIARVEFHQGQIQFQQGVLAALLTPRLLLQES